MIERIDDPVLRRHVRRELRWLRRKVQWLAFLRWLGLRQ